jgi:WD40 repeat protein
MTGKLKWSLQAHVGEKNKGRAMRSASSVAWSPDGKYLATSGAETIRIWNISTRLGEYVLRDSNSTGHVPLEMAWSPDGKYIASGSSNGEIVIWKAESRKKLFVLKGHSAVISSVAWSPDGNSLVSSSYDKTVRLWDTVTGNEVQVFKGHTEYVQTATWSPDGKKLASGGNDGTVRFWDIESGKEVQTIEANAKPGGPRSPFPGIVHSLSWNTDDRTIAFGAADGTVRLIDVGTQNIKGILRGHYGEVLSVRWSPDGTYLASCDFNGTIIIWKKR